MARYIDIDLLIDKVEETDWYHISKQGELVSGANSKDDIPLYKHSDIKEVLNNAPIADVVPKSEVEKLETILNSYALQYGTVMDKHIVIERAKSEVAREIFEEIEQEINGALESNYEARSARLSNPNIEMADEFIAYCEGKISALRGIDGFIGELKKKYTEG